MGRFNVALPIHQEAPKERASWKISDSARLFALSSCGRGGAAFRIADTNNGVGAPLFAQFAKGGHDAVCGAGFRLPKSHRTHSIVPAPATSAGAGHPHRYDVGNSKPGPPANNDIAACLRHSSFAPSGLVVFSHNRDGIKLDVQAAVSIHLKAPSGSRGFWLFWRGELD
jgi:hypothetical protein